MQVLKTWWEDGIYYEQEVDPSDFYYNPEENKMQDVMVDLETLGTTPGCAILSIGAVFFDELSVSDEGFYLAVHCRGYDLHEEQNTVDWWRIQSDEARKVFDEVKAMGTPGLKDGLEQFNDWLSDVPNVRVWGNGADFDNAILACAYRAAKVAPGWRPYNGRCYRTVKNQFPDIRLTRTGTHHNALADARSQAEHLVQICRNRGWKLA